MKAEDPCSHWPWVVSDGQAHVGLARCSSSAIQLGHLWLLQCIWQVFPFNGKEMIQNTKECVETNFLQNHLIQMSGSYWKMYMESTNVNASMPWCLKRFWEAAFVISHPQHNHTSATDSPKNHGECLWQLHHVASSIPIYVYIYIYMIVYLYLYVNLYILRK